MQTQLCVEVLESRALMSVDVWTGNSIALAGTLIVTNTSVTPNTTFHTSKWSDGFNWSLGRPPLPGDDVVFPAGLSAAQEPPATGSGATFKWQNNSEIDQDFTINNLTILGDNFHIDAFPGDSFFPAAIPTLTITGAIKSSITTPVSSDKGMSLIGPLFGATDLTIVLTGTAQTLEADSVGVLDISAPITEPGRGTTFYTGLPVGLTKIGTGEMELSGANSYTGSVNVNQGTLLISNPFGLGTNARGTVVQSGATLAITGAATSDVSGIGKSLTITGSGVNGVGALNGDVDPLNAFSGNAFGNTGPSVWSGNINLAGSATIGVSTLGTEIAVTGQITGAGNLTKVGIGRLRLTNSNAYTGQTLITAGTVRIENNNALSGVSTTVSNNAALEIFGNLVVSETLFLNGNGEFVDGNNNPLGALELVSPGAFATWTGSITMLSNASIGVVNSNTPGFNTTVLTITGALGGAFDLTKVDQGTLRLPNANLNFQGNTFVTNGVVQIDDPNALGSANSKSINVTSGLGNNVQGTLEVDGNYTVSKALTLNGQGFNTQGALHIFENPTGVASNITWAGSIGLAGATSLMVDPVSNLRVTGAISGPVTSSLDKYGLGSLNLAGTNTFLGALGLRTGTTVLETAKGLGAAGGNGTQVYAGASLNIPNPLNIVGVNLTVSGTGANGLGAIQVGAGTTTWTGLVTLLGLNTTEADFNIAANGALKFTNVLNGDANLRKFGAGELDLTGTAQNQFVKTTYVDQGTLALGKTAGLAALGGSIVVGDGVGAADTAVLRLDSSNQIPDNLSLIINTDGLFNLNNNNETLGGVTALTLSGGDVSTGAGKLTLAGNLSTTGASRSSHLTGTLDIGGTTKTFLFTATPATSLATSRSTATVGTAITFTFTATNNPGTSAPTGTVTFFDNGVAIGTAQTLTNNGSVATGTITTTQLTGGSHTITAQYSGDGNYPPVFITLNTPVVLINPPQEVLVSSNVNPAAQNQPVTFTYKISGPVNTVSPTGTVTFFDTLGGVTTQLGTTQTISAAGLASITVPSLTTGIHTITAVYSGDSTYSPSTATLAPTLVVGTIPVVSLSTGSEAALRGTPVTLTFQALGSGGGGVPGGQVTFFDSTTVLGVTTTTNLGTAAINSITGLAQLTVGAGFATVGTHIITAQYSGDAFYTPATATLTPTQQVINPLVTSISANPNPAPTNGTVTYTWTGNGRPGQPAPTGTVTFKSNGSTIGLATVSNGVATITVGAGGTAGTQNITATFTPNNGNYATTTTTLGTPESVVVNNGNFFFTSSNNPALPNTPTTVTVSSPTAYGTVQFLLDGTNFGLPQFLNETSLTSGFVANIPASITFPSLPIGPHTISFTFTAANGSPVGSVTTPIVLSPGEVVTAPITTALTTSASPAAVNAPITFTFVTAVATGAPLPAVGTLVTFRDGGAVIGTGTINANGVATYTATAGLSTGTHTITATMASDGTYLAAPTASLTQVVNGGATSQTTLISSANSALLGNVVTFTYSSAGGSGQLPPTGTVQFFDFDGVNTNPIGVPQVLVGGVASVSTNALTVGVHNITALYSGDANYVTSTATLSPQQVVVEPELAQLTSSAYIQQATQPVTFSMNLFANNLPNVTPPIPTGTVRFFDTFNGTTTQIGGTVTVNGAGVATVTTTGLAVGTHVITATYSGDTHYGPITITLVPNEQIITTAPPPVAPPPTTLPPASPVLQVDGVITGTAQPGLVPPGILKTGAGQLILNAVNTYPGSTVQNGVGGTITLGVNGALPNTDLIIDSGTVDLNGHTQTVASLSGLLSGTLALSGATLITGGSNSSTNYGGVLTDGSVTGGGAIYKIGTGTLTLSGNSPGYTGQVVVAAGTVLDNATDPTTFVHVLAGATLGGTNGTVGGVAVDAGGTVAPGGSGPGVLNSGPITFATGSTFAAQLNGPTVGSQYSQLAVTGTATLNNATLALSQGALPTVGTTFSILTATAGISGTFVDRSGNVLSEGATFILSGRVYQISYQGNQVTLTVTALAGTAALTADVNPAEPGQLVTFTETVTRVVSTDPVPQGTVSFYLDGSPTAFATVALNGSGAASAPAIGLPLGAHTITATYTSSNSFQTITSTLVETVNDLTSTSLSTSAPSAIFGNPVTFTAQVTSAVGVPTGTVSFYNASTGAFLGTAGLDGNGVARLTTTGVRFGTSQILAVYSGDSTFRTSSATVTQVITDVPLYAAGSGPNGPGIVTAFSAMTGGALVRFAPFGAYAGGVKVAVGDVNGDGYSDLIVMAGPGALNGLVQIYSGRDFSLLSTYFAFPGYAGEFSIAAGDLTGNGIADVIFATATGGDFVFAYAGASNSFIVPIFSAFGGFTGGVTLAAGDVLGNGMDQIIVGTASRVGAAGVFNQYGQLLQPYYFAPIPMNGVNVAAADLNNSGRADVIFGARTDSTLVLEFDGASQGLMGYFFAFPGQTFGVTVAAVDQTGNGYANIVTGFTGNVSAIAIYSGLSFQLLDVNGQPSGAGGVSVAGSGSA